MKTALYSILTALIIASTIAFASSIIDVNVDVAVLKEKVLTNKEMLKNIYDDVRWIKERLNDK